MRVRWFWRLQHIKEDKGFAVNNPDYVALSTMMSRMEILYTSTFNWVPIDSLER